MKAPTAAEPVALPGESTLQPQPVAAAEMSVREDGVMDLAACLHACSAESASRETVRVHGVVTRLLDQGESRDLAASSGHNPGCSAKSDSHETGREHSFEVVDKEDRVTDLAACQSIALDRTVARPCANMMS